MSVLSATSALADRLTGSTRLSVSGLASGLDTEKLIEGLLAIQQSRIAKLQTQQSRAAQQQAAYKGIEAKLLALQGHLSQLARAQGNVFGAHTVSSNNENLVTAAVSASASPGVYQIQVNNLAKSHQVLSQGFDAPTSAITEGTLQIRVGAGTTATVTIDSGNNTLQGLANAINSAGAGVTALVLNDGSGTQPYRLLLSANQTGAANSIVVTNNLASETGAAVKPIFDSTFVGAANTSAGYAGTATPTSNRGAGVFTGTANNTYTFTVTTGGTVGTDNGLQIAYSDSTGANTGTITLNAGDADVFKDVAQGIQVKLAAGTLVAGEKFTIEGFVPQAQAGADASVTIGSGLGALTIASASNQVDGLFTGVSLNLRGADPTKAVTLTVADDTAKMKQAIVDVVNGYNEFLEFVDEQTRYDAVSGSAGVLLGEGQVAAIQEAVRNAMMRPIEGLAPAMNRLSALGIVITDQGRLSITGSKLDDALAGKLPGVTVNDVRRLFSLGGVSSHSGIEFVTGSSKTKGSATPYQVTITQAAEQASITATSSLAASTVLTAANNTFTITVDGGVSSTITLTEGTYTRTALAQEVATQINANGALTGRKVTATLSNDQLVLTSSTYGSASRVTIGVGTALTPLGFAGTETDQGVDVAGSFQVNGQTETATGAGQFLTGTNTNAHTADLQVRVTLTPAQVGGGLTGNLTVTRGVASVVDVAVNGLLDPISGRLRTVNDRFDSAAEQFAKDIARQNEIMEAKRETLTRQFVSLERTLSQLQSMGNFLASQFSQLNSLNSTRR